MKINIYIISILFFLGCKNPAKEPQKPKDEPRDEKPVIYFYPEKTQNIEVKMQNSDKHIEFLPKALNSEYVSE